MVSQQLLNELSIILREDYSLEPEPRVVADIGTTLVEYFKTLNDVYRQKEK